MIVSVSKISKFKFPVNLVQYYGYTNQNNVLCGETVSHFIAEIQKKLQLPDWNSLTIKQLEQYPEGTKLLEKYTLNEIIQMKKPEVNNDNKKPKKYWESEENIHNFLNELKQKLNLNTPEDWNKLTSNEIIANGGRSLLKYSMYQIKCMGCPEGKLLFNKQLNKPPGFWKNNENITKFMQILKEKLKLNSPEEWNLITQNDIIHHGGRELLHSLSMYELKCIGCPEGKNYFTKPNKKSGFWDCDDNIQRFLYELKQKFHLNTPEDWNLLTHKQIKDFGGSKLVNKFSIFEIKCLGCPEGILTFNKPKKSAGYWNNEENIKNFLQELREKYNIKNVDDWNRISRKQIISSGGRSLLLKQSKNEIVKNQSYGGAALKYKIGGRSAQRWLFIQIQKLFPGEEIIEDYFHSDISRETGLSIQFDIFLIDKKIAFEYHGKQHYEDSFGVFAPVEMYKQRDKEKIKLCENYGIKLIIIPYWWDNTLESLKETIFSETKLKL